ncbi:nuclear transport factor 2 family protein [Flavobacterium columnare]|uniref:nuclear transport factor 2 family protein n=1 Tax=Flavobacterium columnare TaxID=996 RepID=UPI002D214429|nr:nuclear transport factor 2 family protein [Flavobacterium columnare]MEB3801315.1 nuclear transport factor 2 family protein [Flavobacterium columnare]
MSKTFLLLLLTPYLYLAQARENTEINTLLNNWHKAASEAKFDLYFKDLSGQSVFIGTDATENWNKKAFMNFAKPYFDKGKAWSFSTLKRTIYLSSDKKTAWFDELLETQMKICRGSGVLIKEGKNWKIKHYVLSMTIPNDNTSEVIKIKAPIEDALIEKLKK